MRALADESVRRIILSFKRVKAFRQRREISNCCPLGHPTAGQKLGAKLALDSSDEPSESEARSAQG